MILSLISTKRGEKMNKGVINENLLEKNIQQIEFYAKEEVEFLNKIYNKLEEFRENYVSENNAFLLPKINNYKKNIDDIHQKRKKYCNILREVIALYIKTSNKIKSRVDGEHLL